MRVDRVQVGVRRACDWPRLASVACSSALDSLESESRSVPEVEITHGAKPLNTINCNKYVHCNIMGNYIVIT